MSREVRSLREKYVALLDESVAERSDRISRGECATFEEYKFKAGQIVGIKAARQMFLNEVENVGTDDEV